MLIKRNKVVVTLQQLSELEEIIEFKKCDNPVKQKMIRNTWKMRLRGCQRNVEVWQRILAVRMVVIHPMDDLDSWLKFSSLCRRSGRLHLARKVLTAHLNCDLNKFVLFVVKYCDFLLMHYYQVRLQAWKQTQLMLASTLLQSSTSGLADRKRLVDCNITLFGRKLTIDYRRRSISCLSS